MIDKNIPKKLNVKKHVKNRFLFDAVYAVLDECEMRRSRNLFH